MRKMKMEDVAREHNVGVVREILRTIGRLPQTDLVQAYWACISELSNEIHGKEATYLFGWNVASDNTEMPSLETPYLDAGREEIRHWLEHDPQYVFSLVVGLALSGDENTAWAFAYG